MDQFHRLGKRELIYLLLFTRNYVVSFGEVIFLWMLGMGYVILLWYPLCLPYNDFGGPSVTRLSSISSTDYVNMSILLGELLVPLLAYTMVRAVVDATEIISYVESGLTGHLNDAQTFGLMRRIGTELCFT